ncbi:glycosyl hydrolase family 18 protein [Streptomyces sp. NPDC001941]|uniref:glycosyl hydrolase family 18 protein n=1 Tax=Streptomyces sp. NPDC001941 TaxID=3154659 RepID=UPI003316BAB6
MRTGSRPLRALLACAALPLLLGASVAPPEAPHRSVSAWLPYWTTGPGLADAVRHARDMEVISPFWYDASGPSTVVAHEGAEDPAVVRALRKAGLRVVPTVTETMKAAGMDAMLADPAARGRHVDALVRIASRPGYDGLDLDYERFSAAADAAQADRLAAGYATFVAELCERLHAVRKTCTVTVMYRTADDEQATALGEWHRVFDYARLGRSVDRLRIMGYQLHGPLDAPGPLTTPGWYRSILRYATARVPLAKLEMSLPLHGWDWNLDAPDKRAGSTDWAGADARRRALGLPRRVDPASRTPYLRYRDDKGARRVVWYEDAGSLAALVRETDRAGVRKLTLWALDGRSDPAMWDALKR